MTAPPVDLNRLRDILNANAASGTPQPSATDQRIMVRPSGHVVLGANDGKEAQQLSEVHQGVFSGRAQDPLTKEDVIDGTAVEVLDDERVFVSPAGHVELRPRPSQSVALSEVHPGVFSATSAAEGEVAREKLPGGARWVDDAGARGWMYDVTNEFGDDYCFFVYWNTARSLYMAMMVLPEVPHVPSVHVAHLFESGCLCLSPELGLPTLEACYASTVIFSLGWSTYVRTGQFPFTGS